MRFPRFKQHHLLDDAAAASSSPPPKISNPVLHHSSIGFEGSERMPKSHTTASASANSSSTTTTTSHARGPTSTITTTTTTETTTEPALEPATREKSYDFSKLLEVTLTDNTQVPDLSDESPGGPRASDPTAVEPPELFTEDTKEWSPRTLNPEGIQAKFIPATPMRQSSRRFSVRYNETESTPEASSDHKLALSDDSGPNEPDNVPSKPVVPPKDLKSKPQRKKRDPPDPPDPSDPSDPPDPPDPKKSYADAQVNGAPVAVAVPAAAPSKLIAAPARSSSIRSSGSNLKAAFTSSFSPKEAVSTLPRASSRRFSREIQLKQHLGESEKEATSGPAAPDKSSNSTIEEYKLAISRLNEIRMLQIRQRDERIAKLEAMVMRQQQTNSAKFDQFEATAPSDESVGDSSDSSSHRVAGTRGRIPNMRALFPIA